MLSNELFGASEMKISGPVVQASASYVRMCELEVALWELAVCGCTVELSEHL